jgi:hypothetical protein
MLPDHGAPVIGDASLADRGELLKLDHLSLSAQGSSHPVPRRHQCILMIGVVVLAHFSSL